MGVDAFANGPSLITSKPVAALPNPVSASKISDSMKFPASRYSSQYLFPEQWLARYSHVTDVAFRFQMQGLQKRGSGVISLGRKVYLREPF